MAINPQTNKIIDPYDGQLDLKNKILRCVGSVETRMNEDVFRMLRALRFVITKSFVLEESLKKYLEEPKHSLILRKISPERISHELNRCFQCNTLLTIQTLARFEHIQNEILLRQQLKALPKQKVPSQKKERKSKK